MELGLKSNNQTLFLVILGAIVFFVFILPMIDNQNDIKKLKESLDNTDDIRKLDKNLCSKQCCRHSQWPVPEDVVGKQLPQDEMDNYIGTNLMCNLGNGGGCLCVSKDDFNYLASRGSNAGNMCNN